MSIDHIDHAIIRLLQQDGRTPYTEIAKRLQISEGTVRNRIARLIENQSIQIVALIDPYQMGFDAAAMIGVSVEPPLIEAAAEQIARFPEVSYLVLVSGCSCSTLSASAVAPGRRLSCFVGASPPSA